MGARVLCVDDEVLGLEIRRVVFERAGYTVLTASDGPTAIEVFRENEVDAVVLDYAMPGMDGAQVARALRQIRPSVPILLLSAYLSLPEEVNQWINLLVNKGDGAPTLLRKIEELLAGIHEAPLDK
jgi:CheY-like chemotaxis protein